MDSAYCKFLWFSSQAAGGRTTASPTAYAESLAGGLSQQKLFRQLVLRHFVCTYILYYIRFSFIFTIYSFLSCLKCPSVPMMQGHYIIIQASDFLYRSRKHYKQIWFTRILEIKEKIRTTILRNIKKKHLLQRDASKTSGKCVLR